MFSNKKLAVAVSGAVLLMAGQVALADSTTDIVDALVSKGVLTEEEGKLISKGHTSQKDKTPVVKEKDGAFSLESANGRNSIQLTGRIHLDYRDSSVQASANEAGASGVGNLGDRDTATLADQFELRRARLGVKGKFAKDFNYEIVGNLPGTATVDVAYFDWARYDAVKFRVGKFKQPFNLEELTSSNNITFNERTYVNQTAPAKKIGAQIFGSPLNGVTYAASLFQMNDTELNVSADGKNSAAGRGTINFAEIMGNKEMVMHVGLSGLDSTWAVNAAGSTQTTAAAETTTARATILQFRSAGRGLDRIFRAQVNDVRSVTTATYGGVSEDPVKVNQRAYGLEGIFAYGPYSIQGEYSAGEYKGTSGVNEVSFDTATYYVQGSWFLTGEKYADSYKNGVFGSYKPKNDFDLDKGNLGAIELALRYEGFNVDNTLLSGTLGRFQGALNGSSASGVEAGAKTYTAGIRWILNPNVQVKANYAYTRFDGAFAPIDVTSANTIVDEQLISVRTQIAF